MASPPEKQQLQRYEALVQQKSERWDSERLWELYYDRGERSQTWIVGYSCYGYLTVKAVRLPVSE